jgi:hypothetical protein
LKTRVFLDSVGRQSVLREGAYRCPSLTLLRAGACCGEFDRGENQRPKTQPPQGQSRPPPARWAAGLVGRNPGQAPGGGPWWLRRIENRDRMLFRAHAERRKTTDVTDLTREGGGDNGGATGGRGSQSQPGAGQHILLGSRPGCCEAPRVLYGGCKKGARRNSNRGNAQNMGWLGGRRTALLSTGCPCVQGKPAKGRAFPAQASRR